MRTIYTYIILLLATGTIFAQAPQKMSYQAVARDAGGTLITDTAIGVQISILESSGTGTAVYVETHTPTTNANGLFTLEVGDGSVVSGDFTTIDWGSDSYYLKSEIDPTGGTSYSIEGTHQLLSVPYALYSNSTANGNTLDEAYNQEMTTSPAPRTINADDGSVEIIATGNSALELTADPATADNALNISAAGAGTGITIAHDGTANAMNIIPTDSGKGLDINNSGTNRALDVENSNVANISEVVRIDNDGLGDAVRLDNSESGGGDALNLVNDGGGDGITIDNGGAGDAIFVDNTDSAGSFAISVTNDGGLAAVDILNDGGGAGIDVENDGGGHGIGVSQSGAGNGVNIFDGGTGIGLNIEKGVTNPLNGGSTKAAAGEALKVFQGGAGRALFVDNAGTSFGINVFNGNPANAASAVKIEQGGTGTALEVDNGGPGKAAHFFNVVPLNAAEVLLASTAGVGNVGLFVTEDNNANSASTLVANNMGNGSAGEFLIMDEDAGDKENDKPIITARSNGKGAGITIDLSNDMGGVNINTEPGLLSSHKGYGNGAFLETTKSDNTSATLEVKNNSAGHGAHIDSFDNGGNVEATLYVEQGNSSTVTTMGRTAVFDLHPAGTSADSAVLIRSGATSAGSSALRVIAADATKLAGVFEGDVEVSSDITIGGTMSAAAKAFKIDHPLDPENKYLVHNSIESNERINIYSGNVTTNEEGYATVQLPNYMTALNTDFKYQLTIVDKSFAQAIIWEPIQGETNTFVIKTNSPNIGVSWQITGTRQDTWALENPMQVEVEKNNGI
ncbi:hypothetical protein POV27_04870 [Aureisphaera galaxeae]|uniref:beta strand repeat-containing protein n=1 Tax=Aureisphaera galaxeae TaxID=1538023 RepID=UPI0023508D69|nr:hypothetical protein [Aureisphaera galaxeae]MDC8003370.1 hypothetical protein [Aureisphaera galaxeae]